VKKSTLVIIVGTFALVIAGTQIGSGQQKVPFAGGIPVAPLGLANKPLPQMPVVYDTAEGQKIRVTAVTRALEYPWSFAFLPDGTMLVTERAGRLRVIRNGKLDPQPVPGGPASYWTGESGLPGAVHGYMDIALHPKFAENKLVYLSYTKPLDEKRRVVAVARGKFDGHALTEVKDIWVAPNGGTTKIAFGKDGTLFVTTTVGPGEDAQTTNNVGGKVLRFNDDGSIPKDNRSWASRVRSRGLHAWPSQRARPGVEPHHRRMWLNENGPNGGDEINVLKPGGNYGWPVVSYGRQYPGPWQNAQFYKEGFEYPIVYWTPSIAVSGMVFYTGDKLAKWKGDVFVGSLRTGEVPGTGHLERILFNEKWEELRREIAARRSTSTHSRRAPGDRWSPLRDHRSEGRRGAEDRARPVGASPLTLVGARELARVGARPLTIVGAKALTRVGAGVLSIVGAGARFASGARARYARPCEARFARVRTLAGARGAGQRGSVETTLTSSKRARQQQIKRAFVREHCLRRSRKERRICIRCVRTESNPVTI
jgi:glucose/arabinose dehydrogenase